MTVHAELRFTGYDRREDAITESNLHETLKIFKAAGKVAKLFLDALSFMSEDDELTITFLIDKKGDTHATD